jgi:ABC-type lipoprotein export system ATPase subunit
MTGSHAAAAPDAQREPLTAQGGVLARVEALGKVFPSAERPALDNVSLEIRAGVVTGLVGPDGAGKTTLLRILAGLLLPTSGMARVIEQDPGRAIETLRSVLGYMPQKFGLYEDLTVLENLNLYAELKGLRGGARADHALHHPAGGQALRGHEAEARAGLHAAGQAEGPLARRTGGRRRPGIAA